MRGEEHPPTDRNEAGTAAALVRPRFVEHDRARRRPRRLGCVACGRSCHRRRHLARGRRPGLRPNSAAVQYDLGLAQIKEKKYEEAIISNRKALELKPEWADAYNNLGLAYAGLSRWKEAVTAYREAVRLVPDYAGALYNLGIAYVRLGQNSAAREVVAKVRELNWDLQARLWQEILAIERPATLVAVPEPSPTVTPPTQTSPPETSPQAPVDKAEKDLPSNNSEDEECPSPLYRRSGVTQMALMRSSFKCRTPTTRFKTKWKEKLFYNWSYVATAVCQTLGSMSRCPLG